MTTLSKCMMPSLKNELFNTLYLMIPDTSAVIYIIEMITNEIDNNALIDYCKNFNFKKNKEIGFDNEILNDLKSKFLEAGQVYLQNVLGSDETQPVKLNGIW